MLKFGRRGLGAGTRLGWGKGVAGKGLRGEEWTLGGRGGHGGLPSWGLEQGDTPREPAVTENEAGRIVLGPEFWGTEEGL